MFRTIRKFLKLSFDRSFSGSWLRQVAWLIGAFVVTYLFVMLLNNFVWGQALDGKKIAKLLIDPGAFGEDSEFLTETFIVAVVGALIFSGMLISVISNILERRVENYKKGEIHYAFRMHFVILGYDDMVAHLIHHLCGEERYKGTDIVLQTSQDVERIREEVFTQLDKKECRRVVFIHAQIASESDLRKIHIDRAREVFVFGEKDCEEHDSINITAVEMIAKVCCDMRRKKRLICNTLLSYQTSYSILQLADLDKKVKELVDFRPFNLNEIWAQKVLAGMHDRKNIYQPLDREGITEDSEKSIHLVIVGMTAMGVSMAVTAAHVAHYPNFRHGKRTRITFIDTNMLQEMNFFQARYANLFELSRSTYIKVSEDRRSVERIQRDFPTSDRDFLDIEWEFIHTHVESDYSRTKLREWVEDKKSYLTIAVCFNTAVHSIAAGLYLPQEVYDQEIPVYVYQKLSDGILEIAKKSYKYRNVQAFGMVNCSYELMDNYIALAQGINYLYTYYFDKGYGKLPEFRPTPEQLDEAWQRKTVVERWSNIYSVSMLPTKLRSIGKKMGEIQMLELTDEEVTLLAMVEHNRWNIERLLLGTRPFHDEDERKLYETASHEVRQKMKKQQLIHPDIVPFDKLSANSQNIDIQITKGLELIYYLSRKNGI